MSMSGRDRQDGTGRGGSGRSGTGRGASGRGAGRAGAGSGTGRGGAGRSGAGRGGAGRSGATSGAGRPGAARGGAGGRRAERGVTAGSRPGWVRAWGVDAELAPVRDFSRDGGRIGPGRAGRDDDFDDDDDFADEFGPEGPRDSLIDVPGGVRLQKVLAAAGVGSRRHCEELIGAGRVEVDGEIVRRYGARVDPEHQVIRVDGRRIAASEKLVYVALNKPAGVLTTMSDSRGRRTIADLLGDRAERLFHVGRLDYETEGLMLLMNDGELAHRLAHPRYGVLKIYLADIPGPVPRDLGRKLMTGIELDDGPASADRFRVVERAGSRALVEITLHEGRKHIVRRMLATTGHPVSRLVRTQVGPVALGSLKPGTTRRLTSREVGDLYAAVGL
ncbi:MAG TPA: pseudouridine synthase [Streptosporangiaceae bacterium]|nr:pseudouridine synthase [Streptosporangiaceae bacterium]